jgi:DNA-binding Lrp family transcriptional regulator
MDQIDEKLMALLADDSRASIKTLAAQIGLSRTATTERLTKLKQSGEIEAFTIRTRAHPHARHSLLMVKTVEPSCELLQPWFKTIPEITRMQSLAGDIDILLEVVTLEEGALHQLRETILTHPAVSDVTVISVLKTHFAR